MQCAQVRNKMRSVGVQENTQTPLQTPEDGGHRLYETERGEEEKTGGTYEKNVGGREVSALPER
jgi:hypothetical protein